jgi:hypothetical protein
MKQHGVAGKAAVSPGMRRRPNPKGLAPLVRQDEALRNHSSVGLCSVCTETELSTQISSRYAF